MALERDLRLTDGRLLRVHDAGPSDGLALLWHHGSPQTGRLLPPVADAAADRGFRLLSYARPSYPGSTPSPGRSVASAADDVRQVMDALEIEAFATMGASGGGPHALACGALLPDRVLAAVVISSPAPWTDTFDWYEGMAAPGGLRAAAAGRSARATFAETDEFDPGQFIGADWAALDSAWASLGDDAGTAGAAGPDGLIDDDVAFATPWGFEPAEIGVPVLVVQGDADRVVPPSHGRRLHDLIPRSELWLRPGAGHVSILDQIPRAMDWILARSAGPSAG
jgi:pimeloyl-ACP methyl ester carboxylesterase